jgi:excisionase family DNA binding protein
MTTPSLGTHVADHRELPLQQVAYSVDETAVLLGISVYAVRRLITSEKLRARCTGKRYIIPGAAIADFLAGSDEPMQHPESA